MDAAVAALEREGFGVVVERRYDAFVRINVTDSANGYDTDVDFCVDYRAEPPVVMQIGLVLSEQEAVSNKMDALYSRGEARDYLDVDSIRRSGRFTDAELVDMLRKSDAGLDKDYLIQAVERVEVLQLETVSAYGVDSAQWNAVKTRFADFAKWLRGLALA